MGRLVDEYETVCPNWHVLTPFGINLQHIQGTLLSMRSWPTIIFPTLISQRTMKSLTKELTRVEGVDNDAPVHIDYIADERSGEQIVMVFDHSNLEASASAQVLVRLLNPYFVSCPDMLLCIMSQGDVMSKATQLVVLLCTNGFFMQRSVMEAIVAAGNLQCAYVPLLVEDGFRFPGVSFRDDHLGVARSVHEDPEYVLSLAKNIFLEIAVTFTPNASSEMILVTKAAEIYARCRKKSGAGSSLVRGAASKHGEGAGKNLVKNEPEKVIGDKTNKDEPVGQVGSQVIKEI